jgi:hypothetical protein
MAYATPAALISAKSVVASNVVVETIDTAVDDPDGVITAGATALGINVVTGALTLKFYYTDVLYTEIALAEGAQVNLPQVSNSNFSNIAFSGTAFQIIVLR